MFREFAAAKRRAEDTHNRDVRLAWLTASLMRTRRMPPLERLLSGETRVAPKGQTLAELKAAMAVIAAQHGLKMTSPNKAHGE